MYEEGDVRSEDAGHQRVPPGPPARYERGTERGEQQPKPEGAEFGERLEVQLVGICRIDGRRPVAKPLCRVAPSARPEERMTAGVVQRHSPEVKAERAGSVE